MRDHRRLAIRIVAASAFVVSLIIATTPPKVEASELSHGEFVECRSLIGSRHEPKVGFYAEAQTGTFNADDTGEYATWGDLEARAKPLCDQARQPLDRWAFSFLLIGVALLPWALFADTQGRFRRPRETVPAEMIKTG